MVKSSAPGTRQAPVLSPTSAGLRNTRATVALTALFKDHPDWALTPLQVESALAQAGVEVNRVTVYRLLDRFVAAGLLQRHVDADRVTHYCAIDLQAGAWAPRFECEECHRHFRVVDGSPQVQATARKVLKALESMGHQGHEIEISVRGRCAGCVHPEADR